jgi:D-alanine-D-alanine ligase
MSRRSAVAILATLSDHYAKVEIVIVNTVADLEVVAAHPPDLVFLGMKFVPDDRASVVGLDGKLWLTDYLDEHGIAYTGSCQTAHELELNKPLAKQRALEAGLATSKFYVIPPHQLPDRTNTSLTFPVFIKPANRGGGLGIDSNSVAFNIDELRAKVQSITQKLRSDALVEEYLPGREFSVAILRDEYSPELRAMPVELIAQPDQRGIRMLSGRVKAANAEQVRPVTDQPIRARVTSLALKVFQVLGARDYGRIDIRLDSQGVPHFLEANLIPSLISGYGSFPKACELNQHLGYGPMIRRIARLGLERAPQRLEDTLAPGAISQLPPVLSYRHR